MDVKKIVLTGGPCAGKTQSQKILIDALEEAGWKVFFVPESATQILQYGVNPESLGGGEEGLYQFQKCIFEFQMNKEKMFEDMAERFPAEKKVIIYDRGAADGKAFSSQAIYDRILYEENKNEYAVRDRYDAVFHLVTAAKGAEAFYGNETNAVRRESLDEAAAADNRVVEAWIGHPHLRVIGNTGRDFAQKMDELIKSVKAFLGEPVPKEIEYKYLIRYPDVEALEAMQNCQKSHITQIYLTGGAGMDRRIRQREQGGHISYTYTEKVPVSKDGKVRQEAERTISANKYNTLLKEADYEKHPIVKTRYCVVENEKNYEIDIYPFWDDRAILEIEVDDEKELVDIPDWVEVVRDVTGEKAYKNISLAQDHHIAEPDLEERDEWFFGMDEK